MTLKINYIESCYRLAAYEKEKPLLGSSELAMVLGLPRQTLTMRRKKNHDLYLPKPYCELSMGPCWRPKDIKKWLDTAPPFFMEFGKQMLCMSVT